MSRPLLGITVLGDFIVSEGVENVLANVRQTGATAVALNPTVTCQADKATGKFQPPADAGHSPREFDRPLFGNRALWLRGGPSFHPRAELYNDSPYQPRRANDLTERHGPWIGEFTDACAASGIDVYLQIGAAEPTGLRDEDRPRLPDGSLPTGRIADVASLPSPAVRAYNRAYANDLVAAYPAITGFRIDWPEYPCYTPDEVFQDFSPHVASWCDASGHDFGAIRSGVRRLQTGIAEQLSDEQLRLFAEGETGRAAFSAWLAEQPAVLPWLKLKAALSIDILRHWREIVDELPGPRRKLSAHAFMSPFSELTGFDFSAAAAICDSISPKLYTMHWCLMVNQWGRWLLQRNPGLNESLVTRALLNLLQLSDDEQPGVTLDDFAYPEPHEPHPIGEKGQRIKMETVCRAVNSQAQVFPLVHGYGPVDDFARRFRIATMTSVDGVWVNRYGYLSDQKLAVIAAERV